jgi:hypothetical protein
MKKKTGRPRKSADKKKAEYLQVRVEDAEKQAFTEAAELSGQALSVWVRDQLRQAARRKIEEFGKQVPFFPFPEEVKYQILKSECARNGPAGS